MPAVTYDRMNAHVLQSFMIALYQYFAVDFMLYKHPQIGKSALSQLEN